jgi:hypothetical protein
MVFDSETSRRLIFVIFNSAHSESKTRIKYVFYLVLAICSLQALKGIDLAGYIGTIDSARSVGLETPPYPKGIAKHGDYFQSPITTTFLLPLTYIPIGFSKFLAALYTTLGVFYLLSRLGVGALPPRTRWALLLLFTHGLSDAYLSLNPIFTTAVLLWASHLLSLSNQKRDTLLSGICFSISLALRPFPAVLLPFFLMNPQKRKVLPWIILFSTLAFAITFLFLPNPILWWRAWLEALPLYKDAAEIVHPTFQTPLSLVARFFVFGLGFSQKEFALIQWPLALIYLAICYVFAVTLESKKQSDLAFSLLLSSLYCCFGQIWACGLFYCFPLFVWTFSKTKSPWPLVFSLAYALLPQWAWPRDVWNFMMLKLGVQSWFILASLLFAWNVTRNETSGGSKSSS